MGSAFIAVADDATAASWNPGGLTQLERPEMSVVGRMAHDVDQLGSGSSTAVINDIEQTQSIDSVQDAYTSTTLDYLSIAVPFTAASRNFVASINYQQMFSFEKRLHYRETTVTTDGEGTLQVLRRQHGALDAITASIAGEISPEFSVGASINYWLDGLNRPYAWRYQLNSSSAIQTHGHTFTNDSVSRVTQEHFGTVNAAFGALLKVTKSISLGAVGKLPVSSEVFRTIEYPDNPSAETAHDHFRMRFPFSVGGGLAWRPSDELTLSTDLTFVDWGHFRITTADGQEYLVSGDPADTSWVDGVLTPRVGTEYVWLFSDVRLAGRAGFFFDPEPARRSPSSVYGAGVGIGATFASTSIDTAYQIRVAPDAPNTFAATQIIQIPGVEASKTQHVFYLSIVQYF